MTPIVELPADSVRSRFSPAVVRLLHSRVGWPAGPAAAAALHSRERGRPRGADRPTGADAEPRLRQPALGGARAPEEVSEAAQHLHGPQDAREARLHQVSRQCGAGRGAGRGGEGAERGGEGAGRGGEGAGREGCRARAAAAPRSLIVCPRRSWWPAIVPRHRAVVVGAVGWAGAWWGPRGGVAIAGEERAARGKQQLRQEMGRLGHGHGRSAESVSTLAVRAGRAE